MKIYDRLVLDVPPTEVIYIIKSLMFTGIYQPNQDPTYNLVYQLIIDILQHWMGTYPVICKYLGGNYFWREFFRCMVVSCIKLSIRIQ